MLTLVQMGVEWLCLQRNAVYIYLVGAERILLVPILRQKVGCSRKIQTEKGVCVQPPLLATGYWLLATAFVVDHICCSRIRKHVVCDIVKIMVGGWWMVNGFGSRQEREDHI